MDRIGNRLRTSLERKTHVNLPRTRGGGAGRGGGGSGEVSGDFRPEKRRKSEERLRRGRIRGRDEKKNYACIERNMRRHDATDTSGNNREETRVRSANNDNTIRRVVQQ